ncbi:hypothetical protein HLB44_36365, partial [Aquincola sp. S2]
MNQSEATVELAYSYGQASALGMSEASKPPGADEHPLVRSVSVIGLLGCVYKQREDAAAACDAVERMLRDPLQFRIQRSLAQSLGGDCQYAIDTINKHLETHPDDDGAKVIL